MRAAADWTEWKRTPEQYGVGEQLHFLARLTFHGHAATYCFSFVTTTNTWRFQHLEAITLRLDKLDAPPTSRFPDLPEVEKMWMREEFDVTRDVQWLKALTREKGWDAALPWFADGAGYALASRAWVPFVSPDRAFILYLCWEQARLHGTEVTLVTLKAAEAVVRLRPIYFQLYSRSAHLGQQMSLPDFRRLFEYRWQDRAKNAGWSLSITYEGEDCVLRFSKSDKLEDHRTAPSNKALHPTAAMSHVRAAAGERARSTGQREQPCHFATICIEYIYAGDVGSAEGGCQRPEARYPIQ